MLFRNFQTQSNKNDNFEMRCSILNKVFFVRILNKLFFQVSESVFYHVKFEFIWTPTKKKKYYIMYIASITHALIT